MSAYIYNLYMHSHSTCQYINSDVHIYIPGYILIHNQIYHVDLGNTLRCMHDITPEVEGTNTLQLTWPPTVHAVSSDKMSSWWHSIGAITRRHGVGTRRGWVDRVTCRYL